MFIMLHICSVVKLMGKVEKTLSNYAIEVSFLLNLNTLSTTFGLIVCFFIIIMNWYLFVGQAETSDETKIWSDATSLRTHFC